MEAADSSVADLPLTGVCDPKLASFDRVLSAFGTLHEVPGAALAVTKGGRLVYARGFGYASAERKEAVQPDSLFRIASISKPVTAAAVLRLAEGGKLRLRDKVFDILKFTPHLEPDAKPDPRLKDITILHLLQHTAGWDIAESPDPMVWQSAAIAKALKAEPPAKAEQIIRYMMGRPLDFPPGARHAYSNFGYCLLGRVIESVTDRSYEEYVRKEVLSVLGIQRMKQGKTLPEGRAEGEVKYYDEQNRTAPAVVGAQVGKQVPLPYGAWYLEAMDSHGGWIASAVDLVRFASTFDDPARSKLLTAESIRTMFARPEGAAGYEADGQPRGQYYGCGWSVVSPGNKGGQNHYHGGGLDGSAGLLVRRGDGLNWAVLFNAENSPAGNHLGFAIDLYLHRAADKVKDWPEGDLFGKYL
jgi:N-acyl-D-amino-acid deacylase